jgi:hypothetical protein
MRRATQGLGRHSGFSLRILLGCLLVLSIVVGLTFYHANFVTGRTLLLAFPGWEATYRDAWPRIGGGAVAKDVVLIPPAGVAAGTMRFATLAISVPFLEYYTSAFSHRRGALLGEIRSLRLELGDGHGTLDQPLTPELAPFGIFSGAPFEAEGCLSDTLWRENEIADMGLHPRGIDLAIAFDNERANFAKEQTLGSAGVGRVDVRREFVKHDGLSLFNLVETGLDDVAADEWHVTDAGFVAARNSHCALADKVSVDAFVDRHMQSVRRRLLAVGIAVTPDVDAAYRTYASRGGRLDLVAKYDPPLSAPPDASPDLGALLPRVHGQLIVAGVTHPLALGTVAPRPLAEADSAMATFAIVQREGARDAATTAAVDTTPVAPLRSSATDITVTVNAPPPSALPPAKPAAAAASPVVAPVVVPDADADDAITRYADLANYLGKVMTVHEQDRPVARVELLRVVEGGILVRRHMNGGDVDYVLDRAHFEYAKE